MKLDNHKARKSANPVILAMTGASGAVYGLKTLEVLTGHGFFVTLILSDAAKIVLQTECGINDVVESSYNIIPEKFELIDKLDWNHPAASGSGENIPMVICPCSMGTLASVAHGLSDNLIERAADVCIKELRSLVLVVREMPFSAVHLENMLKSSKLGAIIMAAAPGFYHRPEKIEDVVDFVVQRILNALNIDISLVKPWG